MTNLNKYELLMHRHLTLLKALDAFGVSVKNTDGAWFIANSGKQEQWSDYKQRFGRSVSVGAVLDDHTKSGELRYWVCPGTTPQAPYPEVFIEGYWKRTHDGQVSYEHTAYSARPDWVQEAGKKWGIGVEPLPFDHKGMYTLRFTVNKITDKLTYCMGGAKDTTIVYTGRLNDLLTNLHAVIVRASPAKVD